jgi:hypothetical protein
VVFVIPQVLIGVIFYKYSQCFSSARYLVLEKQSRWMMIHQSASSILATILTITVGLRRLYARIHREKSLEKKG